MPYTCCVPNCLGNYPNDPKVNIFGFPRSEELRQKWVHAMMRRFHPFKHKQSKHLSSFRADESLLNNTFSYCQIYICIHVVWEHFGSDMFATTFLSLTSDQIKGINNLFLKFCNKAFLGMRAPFPCTRNQANRICLYFKNRRNSHIQLRKTPTNCWSCTITNAQLSGLLLCTQITSEKK